jgi:hypothetical protein
MDIINRGAQYKVIDTHDGRVRKIPLTAEEFRAVVRSWYAPEMPPEEELTIDYRKLALDSCKDMQILLDKHPELRASFGNPIFETKGTYTQDKLHTMGEILQQSTPTQQRMLVDRFIDFVLYHWRYGLSELIFNLTVNNGLNDTGQIVLLDFGEITFNKEEIRATIDAKWWLRSFSYTHDIPKGLQPYYAQSLAERLTSDTLDATWNTALTA